MIKELVEKDTGQRVNIIYGQPRVGDAKRNFSDISKARNVLGYKPKFDMDKGLTYTIAYFKKGK